MGNDVFSKRIKELRRKKGLSMEQLAKALNVQKSRVNMWENRGAVPRNDALIALAKYFEVSTDYLLGSDCADAKRPGEDKLQYLQRNLQKLNQEELTQAEGMLKAVFSKIFEDDSNDYKR